MKSLKVYWNGVPMRDIYPHATRWQVFKYRFMRGTARLVKWTLVLSVLSGLTYGGFTAGQNLYPKTIYADPVEVIAPVLMRIAKAESHNSQFCTDELIKAKMCSKGERGQVLTNANSNDTVDVGKYQINLYYWGSTATDQGLNLFNEQDNQTFAIWLFDNYGSQPWEASRKNGWGK